MTKRAQDGKRRPPDRQPVLLAHWREMVRQFAHPRLFLAGKSMGEGWRPSCFARGRRDGCCRIDRSRVSFPPPAKPDAWRGEVLKLITTPTLLLQGERDTFGSRAELADFPFSPAVSVHWLTDGDHGFKPRKASGMSEQENLRLAAERIKDFIAAVGRS